jgi:hypothetical protein
MQEGFLVRGFDASGQTVEHSFHEDERDAIDAAHQASNAGHEAVLVRVRYLPATATPPRISHMLQFQLCQYAAFNLVDDPIEIDAAYIVSVLPTITRRPIYDVGGARTDRWSDPEPVAVVRMVDGFEYTVHDPERSVTQQVAAAKGKVMTGPATAK